MKEKNKYGQYFTEGAVANFMVSLISHKKDAPILEPSCGKGIFLKMLQENGFTNFSAYEIDSELAHDFFASQIREFHIFSTFRKI